MGDVDAALAAIGPATLVGRGLGAYVALLVAGARPADVRGAVLADGPGLDGGGPGPVSTHVLSLPEGPPAAPDPFALAELSRDPRPPDYATAFARQAVQRSAAAAPLVVAARYRPPWLAAVASEPGVADVATVAEGLALITSGEPAPS
jgi:pimeloyl-ACP methyl ester carboxylesterase